MTGWWFAIGHLRDAGARLEVSMSNLLDLLLAGLATGAIYAIVAVGFTLLVNPMLRHGVLPLAIATMALAIGIKEAVKQFFSAEASPFPSIVPAGDISVFGRLVS